MFTEFPKIARFNRECVISEKIDGTNAHVFISADSCGDKECCSECAPWIAEVDGLRIAAGSRTRYITPDNDNHGFAKWVKTHAEELIRGLGVGRHYGEWWGSGIRRGYGLTNGDKRFSLFNTRRWNASNLPSCVGVVPVLWTGTAKYVADEAYAAIDLLRHTGSVVAPGFMNPEGIVIYHTAANQLFKITLKNDDVPKSMVK